MKSNNLNGKDGAVIIRLTLVNGNNKRWKMTQSPSVRGQVLARGSRVRFGMDEVPTSGFPVWS